MNFASYKLGDICRMKYGKMPPKAVVASEGFPIFSGYRITGCAKEYLYDEPRVIVVARGVGGTGDVKMSPEKSWITNLSIVIEHNKEIVDKLFLLYRLGQEPLKEKLNTGAAQAQITIDSLSAYSITLPPLEVQIRIASIIAAYDDLIENNRRRIQLLGESARLLYKEWFVRLRFPGHEHVKVVDGVPEGWEKRTLGEVAATNVRSYTPKTLPERIFYVDISSVSTGRINGKKEMPSSEAPGRARRIAQSGDIIWSNVRPNLKAYALVLSPGELDVFSTGFTVVTPLKVPFTFLYIATTTEDFVGYLVNHATGASYPAVRADDFENAELLIPSASLLETFQEKTVSMFDQIHVLEEQSGRLAQARDLLLPRLMNGEVAV